MKKANMIVALLLVVSTGTMTAAQEAVKAGTKATKETGDEKNTADFMASLWSKVVKSGKKQSSAVPTSVAGLRGSEQEKAKELAPYWKGKEKSKDGAAMGEIEALINKKDYTSAIEALKAFGPSYQDSPLKPTSVLMLAYCYTQAGKPDEARAAFEGFLKGYPNHELAADAKAGIELLKKGNK